MLSLRDKVVGGTVCYRHIVPNGTDSNAGQAVFVVPPLGQYCSIEVFTNRDFLH